MKIKFALGVFIEFEKAFDIVDHSRPPQFVWY